MLLVVTTVVEATVEDVIAVVEVFVTFEVVADVDVGLEVVVVAGVVELVQDAKTKVTTIKQANNIQISPFCIYPRFVFSTFMHV